MTELQSFKLKPRSKLMILLVLNVSSVLCNKKVHVCHIRWHTITDCRYTHTYTQTDWQTDRHTHTLTYMHDAHTVHIQLIYRTIVVGCIPLNFSGPTKEGGWTPYSCLSPPGYRLSDWFCNATQSNAHVQTDTQTDRQTDRRIARYACNNECNRNKMATEQLTTTTTTTTKSTNAANSYLQLVARTTRSATQQDFIEWKRTSVNKMHHQVQPELMWK